MRTLGLVILLLVSVAATIIWYAAAITGKRKKFIGRAVLTENEFYLLFLLESPCSSMNEEQVIFIAKAIGEYLYLNPMTLRPSDKIQLLGPAKGWEYDDEIYDLLSWSHKITMQSSLAETIEILHQEKIFKQKQPR